MREYKNNPDLIKQALPHWDELVDSEWDNIAKNIGWISFEDIIQSAIKFSTIDDPQEKSMIIDFFKERNLV
jgi:hypothetical protein